MQQNETSFPAELNLDRSLLSNESPTETTQTEPTPGPSNEPRTTPKKGRKPKKKVTQGSKFDFRVCTICQAKVKKIGQHLDKMHPELEDVHRKFLMSFFRTQNARITVFQCVNCPLRLTIYCLRYVCLKTKFEFSPFSRFFKVYRESLIVYIGSLIFLIHRSKIHNISVTIELTAFISHDLPCLFLMIGHAIGTLESTKF